MSTPEAGDEARAPKTWDDIRAEVDSGEGVATLWALSLRKAYGAGRLTLRINGEISSELRARGLGHVPSEISDLPTDQWGWVRIYDATKPIGRIIEAAQRPGEQDDQRLREGINGDAADILKAVRALVAE
jgi:hypothetical protein